MTDVQNARLVCYQFDNLFSAGVVHGIYSRKGGVSPHPWASLNLGGTVGDIRENVIENRRRIFEHAELKVESIYDVWQVHSADVIVADNPRPLDHPHIKADAIITNRVGVTLFMRFADCVPIFLYDPIKNVVGIVHAGWMGTVKRITSRCVESMITTFGCSPEDIQAGIGPSIGPDHYEVGENVIKAVHDNFDHVVNQVLKNRNGSMYFDLWAANRLLLDQAGVKLIKIAGQCTACDVDHWYSHRAEKGKTGRFGALIALKE
jgi:polyphenol oxidase